MKPWSLRGLQTRVSLRAGAIQSKIERKHIDARLAENPEGAALDVVRDELADVIFRQVAGLRNARHLKISGLGGDIGIEPAADVVTRSVGTWADGFSCFSFSASAVTRSISALLVGPRLDPMELAAL